MKRYFSVNFYFKSGYSVFLEIPSDYISENTVVDYDVEDFMVEEGIIEELELSYPHEVVEITESEYKLALNLN